jgi:hypothetical protein
MKKTIAISVMTTFLSVLALPAQAAMVETEQLIQQQSLQTERAKLAEWVQRDEVKAQLLTMGVDESALESRIAALTDAEVAEINQQMQDLPAGADVLGVVLVVFIVLVITDLLGASDVFPFINPVN